MLITKETKIQSNVSVDRQTGYKQIKKVLMDYENGLTAREIAYKLGFLERNATAPRCTELVKRGELEVVGKKCDKVTNCNVAIYSLKRRKK